MAKQFNCNDCEHRTCKHTACVNGSGFKPKKDESKISIELDAKLVNEISLLHWKMTDKPNKDKSAEELEAQKILAHISCLCDR